MKPPRSFAALQIVATTLIFTVGCGDAPSPEPSDEADLPGVAGSVGGAFAEIVGQAPRASQGSPSVVMLRPRAAVDVPVPDSPAVMDQFGREFIPRLLVVREGQEVLFKNSEDELHTVHVKDGENASLFNVAMPIQGGEHTHTFSQAGDYAVSCNAHPEMHATILVVQTPYAVVANRDGSFTLSGVTPDTYDLTLRQGVQRHDEVVEITSGQNKVEVEFPSAG